jgi:DNA-binding Lrp family transcriptional regulator
VSSEHDQAVAGLLEAGRVLSTAAVMFHSAVADSAGLTVTESKAMEIIQRLGPMTPAALAEESGLAPASVTDLLDRLTRKGVARRRPHPSDKRRALIEIDPGYARRNSALFDDFVSAMREVCARYDVAELQLITHFLTASARCQQDATSRLITAAHGKDGYRKPSTRRSHEPGPRGEAPPPTAGSPRA